MLFLRDIDSDVQLRCCACGHSGLLPRAMLVRRFGQSYPVLSIAPHYRCSRCDSRDTESRPALVLPTALEHEDAPDPSFDASLAALNGLLASIRGSEDAESPPKRASSGPAPTLDSALDPMPDHPMPDWNLDSSAPLDALPPDDESLDDHPPARRHDLADTDDEDDDLPDWANWRKTLAGHVDEPRPSGKPDSPPPNRQPPNRPLEELIADGPLDDADPLWEPVSLADMANRNGAPPPALEDDAEDWSPPSRKPAPISDDAPADETLDAMRRFFAQADLEEEEEDAPAPERGDDEEEDEARADQNDEPPVFSHKALVRRDFDEDLDEDLDDFADDSAEEDVAADKAATRTNARDWAESLDDEELTEEEPTDEEILAFAIRDPEKLAPLPSPPPPPSVKAKTDRPTKRPAASAEEDGGFDKTLAALRSMIEDAATEPKAAPRRKAKPAAPPPVEDDETDDAPPPFVPPSFAILDEDAPPPRKPAVKPSLSKGGNAKQSAQEREIEEAMKALRDLVEDDEEAPPRAATPPRDRKAPPASWDEEEENAPPSRASAMPPPRPAPPRPMDDDEPLPVETFTRKAQADKDASPLSKTIATLRGMLELDGQKKR